MTTTDKIQIHKLQTKVYNILIDFKKKHFFIQRNRVLRPILFFFALFIIFSILFFLNKKTLVHGDDYVYSYIFTTMNRITSFSDVIESQKIHYMTWGGRSIVHTILQFLLMLPPLIIDLINSTVFVGFIYLIYLHIKGKGKHSLLILGVTFCLIWLLQPVFGDTILWITGSVNYLWGTTILLLFLLPYRFYRGERRGNKFACVLLSFLFFLLGIIAGWTTENTSIAVIAMGILFLLYYKINSWKIPAWSITGIFGACIGYAFMIAAPGNFVRAEGASVSALKMAFNLFSATQAYIGYMGVLLLFSLILYFLFMHSDSEHKSKTTFMIFIYLTGTLIATYSMVLSPFFAARSWFGIITFGIIIGGICLYNLNSDKILNMLIRLSIFTYCFLAFLFSFYDAYKDISMVEKARINQLTMISSAKHENKKVVILEKITPNTKFGLLDIPYALKYMSDYYEIEIEYEK